MLRRGRGALNPDGPLWLLRHITGIATKWFDSARVPRPCDRVRRKLATSYPSFIFGLLSPIENTSLIRQGLARAEIDPAGANGESRGTAPGRRAAPPLRTTDRLRPCPP